MVDKITPEGLAPIVLWSDSEFVGENDPPKYFFSTQTDGTTTAKSPMGMFLDLHIDNDLKEVINACRTYYSEPQTAIMNSTFAKENV